MASMVSPIVYPTVGESCLSANYSMLGKGIKTVIVETVDQNYKQKEVLFRSDEQIDTEEWNQMNIQISPITQPIHVCHIFFLFLDVVLRFLNFIFLQKKIIFSPKF